MKIYNRTVAFGYHTVHTYRVVEGVVNSPEHGKNIMSALNCPGPQKPPIKKTFVYGF